MDRPNSRNKGFVYRESLAEALGIGDEADPLRAQLRHIRVTSKLERAVGVIGRRKAG